MSASARAALASEREIEQKLNRSRESRVQGKTSREKGKCETRSWMDLDNAYKMDRSDNEMTRTHSRKPTSFVYIQDAAFRQHRTCGRQRVSEEETERKKIRRKLGNEREKFDCLKHTYTTHTSKPYTLHTKLENGPNAFEQRKRKSVCASHGTCTVCKNICSYTTTTTPSAPPRSAVILYIYPIFLFIRT